MTSANAVAEAPPLFSAVLTPHRSLARSQLRIVIVGLAAPSVVIGAGFWAAGAWPVPGFLGLDVLLVYLAFRLNYWAAGQAEEITLTGHRLTVRRTTASGRVLVSEINPHWARLEVARRPGLGVVRLCLASHGHRLEVGRFLGADARAKLAGSLAAALAEARSART
ncbi:MAG: DUF2244 domain-containing protein [Bauldia sp.]